MNHCFIPSQLKALLKLSPRRTRISRPCDIRGYCKVSNQAKVPIVISGISGRFPKASSTKELNEKLLKSEELTTETTSRWTGEKLPKKFGFLHDLDKFDAGFFNLPPRQANQTDPQIRLLLEATFEAIVDAGMNPTDLRGSETGVFCGAYGGEASEYKLFHFNRENEGYHMSTSNFMIAARIAFSFDLHGPSTYLCTACSSSFTALETALHYINAGKCEAAIVTGSSVHLNPFASSDFLAMDALSPDGRCKTFDASANGFVRSEAAVAILIQKEPDARRNYARIKEIGSSTDGFKHAGIFHPTSMTQADLLEKVYKEADVDPAEVSYYEAHGTGTAVGDPEEIKAIHQIFCQGKNNKKREKPLLLGSVKTNVGHTECAAGLTAVAKAIGVIQNGTLPPNLFFNNPNPEIKSLFDGSLKVLTEAAPFNIGIIGISSMGVGGTNTHLILEPGPHQKKTETKKVNFPILLPCSGRSESQVRESIAEAGSHADNPEFVYLMQKAFERNIQGHTARGFGMFDPETGKHHVEATKFVSTTRPVWVIFPGMGSQWSGMGQDLVKIEPFAESIQQSRMTLRSIGVELDQLLKIDNESIFTDIHDAFIVITVMQIALWDTLKELQVKADGFIGHSAGECLCAYADGCYTAEETLQITHARGRAMKESQKVVGGMSSIGMSPDEIRSRLPHGIELACYNAPNNVTISGEHDLVTSFTKKLKDEGRLAVHVNTCGTAAHSSYVREAASLLKSYVEEIIKGDRPRSHRWISTSIPEAEWGSDLAQFASPEYIENNVFQPVLFYQALEHVKSGSTVIEVSPKGFFQALLTETVPSDCTLLAPMTTKADDKLWHFLQSAGEMYTSGMDVKLDKLYPSVSTPVSSNVPSLSHLVKWDHSASWKTHILEYPLDITHESAIDIEQPSYVYLTGHKIDNRILMPATGLLCGVWNQLGDIYGKDYETVPVQFKNVVLSRATTLSPGVETTIVYKIDSKSGTFTIENQDEIVVTGKIKMVDETSNNRTDQDFNVARPSDLVLTQEDVYKDIRLRGGFYSGQFQGIRAMESKGRWADIAWEGNWTCFLDAMLQSTYFSCASRQLALPVDFKMITIDPVEFKKHLQSNFEETGRNVVRIVNLPNEKKIIAPGIEIKGLQVRRIPQIQRRGNVAYESYSFRPFFKTGGDATSAFEELVDLVLENNGGKFLEVVDVFTQTENSLACQFQRVLSRKPRHDCNITMMTLTTEAEKLEDSVKVGSVVAHSIKGSLTPQAPTDIVFLDDPTMLPQIVPTVKTNGFVFVHSNEPILGQGFGLEKCATRLIEGKSIQLFRKVELEVPEIVHVSVDSPDFAWVPELQTAIQNFKDSNCKVFLTSQGDPENGILGLVNCLRRENGGERIRCIFDPQGQLSLNFEQPDDILRSIIINDLFVNVYNDGILGSYRHVSLSLEHQETFNEVSEAFLGTLTPADLSSLRWIVSPLLKEEFAVDSSCTPGHERSLERYKVAYAPLNFRDVLLATNTIPLGPEFSYNGPYLGFEFSGFDRHGKRVMGICRGNGLATSVMADPSFVWRVPDNWSLEEAATIPIVYTTVLCAFHTRARLQPGQTVLIHAGTGGVGQAAISVALAHGCQVFTTVGTAEKREYIKKLFPQITDDFIGNSRDTSFEAQVMHVTKGRGVDIALNSLAGDKLMATVSCVAKSGTFLEIGVFDAFMNTQMGLRPFLDNINFCGVELNRVIQDVKGFDQVLGELLDSGMRSGAVKPLPRRVFEYNQVEEAFRFMASGKHTGKLVVKLCDESNWKERVNLFPVIKRSYFAAGKTYLIAGGLGGFGLEVAGWMVERGARNLVLNSRSGVTSGYQELCLRRWEEAGVEVQVLTEDLSEKLVAEQYIENLMARGKTLGGIFNSALYLRDEEFSKQTIENFEQVSKPKDRLTKTLDEISRKLCPDLDYFVTFSSLSCGRGNADQTNYGWANSSMERICEKRREDGFHGLAIQWGILGQVGVVAEKLLKGMEESFELEGTRAQSMHSCLQVLDSALQQPFPVVSSCVIAEKGTRNEERVGGLIMRMEKIFGLTDLKAIPAETKLSELGLDSLVAVELKQTLEREREISITKEHLQLMTVEDLLAIDAGTFHTSKFRTCEKSQEIYVPFKLNKSCLVSLKSRPSDRNAFIVHGSDGGCDNFKPLASRLNVNVYGLQFTGREGWNSIPELASQYALKIKEKQPTGPYTIIGYSGGTAIAFEIAQKLKELKETVQNLIFLDGCPSFEKANISRTFLLDMLNSWDVLRNVPQDSIKSFESALTGDADNDFLEVLKVLKLATGYELAHGEVDAYAYLTKQLASHSPGEQYHGDIVLIQAMDLSVNIFTPKEDYGVSEFCAGKVIRRKVRGNHFTFLHEDNVDEAASFVNEFLDQIYID